MKITIELDDGKVIVFQKATDALLVVRTLDPMVGADGEPALLAGTHSHSWSSGVGALRELVKEMAQAGVEVQRRLAATLER